jgi:hypothetical protein
MDQSHQVLSYELPNFLLELPNFLIELTWKTSDRPRCLIYHNSLLNFVVYERINEEIILSLHYMHAEYHKSYDTISVKKCTCLFLLMKINKCILNK